MTDSGRRGIESSGAGARALRPSDAGTGGVAVTRELVLQLGAAGQGPLFLQIARAIVEDIERGRLRPGERLPSSRKLAIQLGVHRKTVIAAFLELARQGWITSAPASGTYVSSDLPAKLPPFRRRALADRAGFDLPGRPLPAPSSTPRAGLLLLGGVPELGFVPRLELCRAYRRALLGAGARALMDYGDPRGEPRLRRAVVESLTRARGVRASVESVNIVRGSQQGLYLAARALLEPGDCVAIEAYSHPAARGALELSGVELVPVPLDGEGLDVAALEALCAARRIKAVYTTPHHQLPTTVTLTAPRRVRLLELARRRRLLVLEDDYDHEFRYEGRPVLPLSSADRHGVVVYLGTLSKILAPGLRLGFVVSTPDVAERIAAYRAFVDHQGDHAIERAVAELLEDGEIDRHTQRVRRAYRARRDALCEALARHLPGLEFDPPSGGMALWARAPGVDIDAWARRAHAAGVSFQPASHFALGRWPLDFARFGFAACDEAQLADAARRLAQTLPKARSRPAGDRP
ncbi:PLP-dependent aminotransferase family protein [Sorangium sp. So ce367]|uniref:MocR-like pyridoxine biosynthesis transcription factor PdxR n=1 Tax=Sorangium sp. So ce367 TaxID=3133305 RepID=UPI003F61065B